MSEPLSRYQSNQPLSDVLTGVSIDPNAIIFGLEKALAEQSLKEFVRQAWHIVEPRAKLTWNWHLDIICEHLEAVSNTFIVKSNLIDHPFYDLSISPIQYLWINIPPRHTKSLIISVFWPCWEWGPLNLPHMKYIYTSYAQELSTRDNIKRRRILRSRWFQQRWGDNFAFAGDQNAKTRFLNDKTGYCISSSVGGLGTGEGGDRIVVDDAHNTREAESETKRIACINWWDDSMSSRLNDEDTGAYIGIMQRCHQEDLSGHVHKKMKKGELNNYAYVCLPGRYELKHPFPSDSPLPINDPRKREGDPLDNERYPDHKLKRVESRMTPFAKAGQVQQRPTIKGGQIFEVANIKLIEKLYPPIITKTIRYWDKAGTEDGGKRTAGVKMARCNHKDYDVIILDCVVGQWEAGPREQRIGQVAQLDGNTVRVYVEQEPGSGGKESAQNSIRKTLRGFPAYADVASGDKFVRMDAFAAAVYNGRVAMLQRPWTSDMLEELENCGPGAAFVDRADAASGAFNKLNAVRTAGTW